MRLLQAAMRSQIKPLDVIVYSRGEAYVPELVAVERRDRMWEGRIRFHRIGASEVFETATETTQSGSGAIEYWAAGLTLSYFEGALERARGAKSPAPGTVGTVYDDSAPSGSADERARRITNIERYILWQFHRIGDVRLPTSALFDQSPYANADLVRAFEALEKQHRLLVRKTEEGTDWLYLTIEGARSLGIQPKATEEAVPDPPRNMP